MFLFVWISFWLSRNYYKIQILDEYFWILKLKLTVMNNLVTVFIVRFFINRLGKVGPKLASLIVCSICKNFCQTATEELHFRTKNKHYVNKCQSDNWKYYWKHYLWIRWKQMVDKLCSYICSLFVWNGAVFSIISL